MVPSGRSSSYALAPRPSGSGYDYERRQTVEVEVHIKMIEEVRERGSYGGHPGDSIYY